MCSSYSGLCGTEEGVVFSPWSPNENLGSILDKASPSQERYLVQVHMPVRLKRSDKYQQVCEGTHIRTYKSQFGKYTILILDRPTIDT